MSDAVVKAIDAAVSEYGYEAVRDPEVLGGFQLRLRDPRKPGV